MVLACDFSNAWSNDGVFGELVVSLTEEWCLTSTMGGRWGQAWSSGMVQLRGSGDARADRGFNGYLGGDRARVSGVDVISSNVIELWDGR